MTYTNESLVAFQKTNIETMFGLTTKAFEGMEKLVELNLQAARTSLTQAAQTSQAALSVKDAQELMALQASLVQPAAEKAAAYSRQLYDILAGINAEMSRAAEATMAEGQRKVQSLVDTAVRNAPAGTESAAALVKSAVAAANNTYDSMNKAAKQAAEVAEANFNAVTNNAAKAGSVIVEATNPRRAA